MGVLVSKPYRSLKHKTLPSVKTQDCNITKAFNINLITGKGGCSSGGDSRKEEMQRTKMCTRNLESKPNGGGLMKGWMKLKLS